MHKPSNLFIMYNEEITRCAMVYITKLLIREEGIMRVIFDTAADTFMSSINL